MKYKKYIWIIVIVVIVLAIKIYVGVETGRFSRIFGLSSDSITFTDTSKTFSFSYPKQFASSSEGVGYPQDWRTNATTSGTFFVVVNIPQTFMPNTNFGEAKFTVGASAYPDAVANCLKTDYENMSTTSDVVINSKKFSKINFVGAGAGNYYDTTSYRTIHNDQCYAVEYTIHSTNIQNYSPDQGIKEFDKAKVTSILENIVKSFKFF